MSTRRSAVCRAHVLALALTAIAASSARADAPLATRIPADAILYVGWRGGASLGPEYQQSHTKAVIEATGLAASLAKMGPQIVDRLGEEDPQAAAMADLAINLGSTLWNYPAAVYIALDEPDAEKGPAMPRLAVVVEAGEDAPKVEEQVRGLLDGAPPDVRLVRFAGGRLMLTNAPEGPIDALSGGPGVAGAALAAHPPFTTALKNTHADPVVAVYLDTETLVKRMRQLIATRAKQAEEFGGRPPRDDQQVQAVLDMLKAEGVKRVVAAAGIEGMNWSSALYVEAPAPRAGLAALLASGTPIDDAALKVIPRNAAIAGATSFDLAGLYDTLRQLAANADPNAVKQFDAQLAEAEEQLGIKLRDDLLAPLGPQWMYYTDAGVAGTGLGGMVLVNKLRDPAKAQAALAKLVQLANAILAEQIDEPGLTIEIKSFQRDGVTIHYTGTPAVAPAWAIHDGCLYLGLQPQVVAGALDFARSGEPAITANPAFLKLRMAMRGSGAVASFSYVDLPQKINDAYVTNVFVTRYLTGIGDMFGIDAPPMLLPPLSQLRKHLEPSMTLSWTDDAGIVIRSREPFPMSTVVATDASVNIAGPALAAGILLPSLGRAREISNRTISATNLSGFYKAAFVHSITNKDKFPDDLGLLVQQGDIGLNNVIHPADSDRLATFPSLPLEDPRVRQWVNANSSYVWRKGLTSAVPADEVVAHEAWHIVSNANHDEGMNVLYGDGRVEFVPVEDAVNDIKRSGLPVPPAYQDLLDEEPAAEGQVEKVETAIVRREAAVEAAVEKVLGTERPEPPPPGDAYYYDVVKKEYFTDTATKIAPIQSAAGNDAVRAHFFTCGECTDDQRFLGYYEKYSADVKAKIEKNPQSMHFYEEVFRGRFYCPPDADPSKEASWVAAETPEGFAIAQKLQEKCPPRKLRYCPPPMNK